MSVLSKTALKAAIDAAITTNGTNSITGAQLNSILNNVADSYQDTLPQLTTDQINALTPTLNQLVYNTTRNYVMQYNGSVWVYLVAMFIGTTSEVNAAANKAGQIYFDTDTNSYFLGAPSGKNPVVTGDCTCIKTVKVSLSSAQILDSNTTPIELIAAPGAGLAIIPISVVVKYTYITAAYATNTSPSIFFDTLDIEDNNFIDLGSMLTQTANKSAIKIVQSANGENSVIANKALMWAIETGNPTAGDGTIDLYITYQVITL
jgi:hypothetical protein